MGSPVASEYHDLFGSSQPGRPPGTVPVAVTGDPRITTQAVRRATRVLKARHMDEYAELVSKEAEYLRSVTRPR